MCRCNEIRSDHDRVHGVLIHTPESNEQGSEPVRAIDALASSRSGGRLNHLGPGGCRVLDLLHREGTPSVGLALPGLSSWIGLLAVTGESETQG